MTGLGREQHTREGTPQGGIISPLGYVTNISALRLTGNEIVAAYHELFQVER